MTKHFGQDFDLGRSAGKGGAAMQVVPKLFNFMIPLIITALALAIGYLGFGH